MFGIDPKNIQAAEEARVAEAKKYGLPDDAGWPEIDNAKRAAAARHANVDDGIEYTGIDGIWKKHCSLHQGYGNTWIGLFSSPLFPEEGIERAAQPYSATPPRL